MSDTRVEALENEILDLRRRLAAAEASPPPEERKGFEYELQALLNSHCKENDSNTPDFILANYITRCLETFTVTTRERERWYGHRHKPGGVTELIEATNPGEHVVVYHGNEQRTGVVDRWSWSCRCGTGSKKDGLTLEEAKKDFGEHLAEAKRCGF